jgi:CHASE2 domain-containing sensor protein
MSAAKHRGTYWTHVTSWRFVVTLAALFVLDAWLERTTVAERATLGGFDTASERTERRLASHTVVVAISALEVRKYFRGRRPVPPAALDTVVTRLLRFKPAVLVIDVFTDDSAYAHPFFTDAGLLREQGRLVWAQAVDSATHEALPVLGGVVNPPGRTGLAAILADPDRIVRRFRPRFAASGSGPASDTVESLPLAAANAYRAQKRDPAGLTRRLPGDTGSIALRTYDRDPPFYLLDDVLSAPPGPASAPDTLFANRVVVLGFIDGSDVVITPRGVRTGSEVVADAVETLLDDRGAIRGFPAWLEWGAKIALALLVGFIHFRFPPRVAAASMVVMAVGVVYLGFLVFAHAGYWTNFILIVVGMWIEQLYESTMRSTTGTLA